MKVPFIGIANLLLGEAMYPEFIQAAATPAALARQLRECLNDPTRRERTAAQALRLRELLGHPGRPSQDGPTDRSTGLTAGGSAADWLARFL